MPRRHHDVMTDAKVFTVRLSQQSAHRAEFIARADRVSVNEVFRAALDTYLEVRKGDPAFLARAHELVAEDARLVEEMA
jgi:hypothetical protein